MLYSIRVGDSERVFIDTEDTFEQVVANVLTEMFGEVEWCHVS